MNNRLLLLGFLVFLWGCAERQTGSTPPTPIASLDQTEVADSAVPGQNAASQEQTNETTANDETSDADTAPAEDTEPTEENDLEALMAAVAGAEVRETKAGRMVADRELAHSLIEYGQRAETPEAIILGVEILRRNPVKSVTHQEGGEEARKEQLGALLKVAAAMRPDDEILMAMADNTIDALDETTRGLAAGPQEWTIRIDKGKYYQLDPKLVYNAQEAAIITAYSSDPKAMLGASVRLSGAKKTQKRTFGRGKVKIEWNSGNDTTGWDCRIFNMTGQDGLEVRVETN